jgi:hypothetical protein
MDTQTLETLVKIFQGVGADTKEIVMAILVYYGARFALGIGLGFFIVIRVTGIIRTAVTNAMMTGEFHRDSGGRGEVEPDDRRRIRRIFHEGLRVTKEDTR